MRDILNLKQSQWSAVTSEDSLSVSSQNSLHSEPQTRSLTGSEVNSVYSINWGGGSQSYGDMRNDDAMSISSQSTRLSYIPLTQGSVSGFSEGNFALGKRKFSCITEAISDSDEDISEETVPLPKRPRTPIESSDQISAKSGFFSKSKEFLLKLLLIILKLGGFLFCLVTILLCYTGYKNYQCSQYR